MTGNGFPIRHLPESQETNFRKKINPMEKNEYYIGIKVAGLNHWLWFKKSEVKNESGTFTGTDGWGESGCHIKTFSVLEKWIDGKMESKNLMYTQ